MSSQSIQERLRDNTHAISSLAPWNSAKWLAASQLSQALHRSRMVKGDRQKKVVADLVTCEGTVNFNKRLNGATFKKRAPRAVRELPVGLALRLGIGRAPKTVSHFSRGVAYAWI